MIRATTKSFIVLLSILSLSSGGIALVRGQVSTEEAERRLRAKSSTRPATTQQTEMERLRDENRRLRERMADLQQEVLTLKQMLAQTPPAASGPAATQPAAGGARQAALVGRWRGGDLASGSSYILQFDPDGTYKQTFVFGNAKEAGQYRFIDDNTLEMWSSKAPNDRKHNQYKIETAADQITLTPTLIDGVDVKAPRSLALRRAE